MAKTKKEFEKLIDDFANDRITDKQEFDRLLSILTLETLLKLMEVLRDLKRSGLGNSN